MTTERGHAVRWVCPGCMTSIRAEAREADTAQEALEEVAREHITQMHPGERVNAQAAASWLAAAGHRVQLWGGPFDGAQLWLPPGPLPTVVEVVRMDSGALAALRGDAAAMVGTVPYRQGELVAARARGGLVRYLHDVRPR